MLNAPEAGPLSAERVANELLDHLHAEPGGHGVSFAESPGRLLGGFETLIFAFRLTGGPRQLSVPLVVRLFPEPGGVGQAKKEAAFQNAVSAAGYPVPRVVVPGGERRIGGRAFNIMERVRGRSLLAVLGTDMAAAPRAADLLARTHARLHAVPSGRIETVLRDGGVSVEQFSTPSQLRFLERYVEDTHLRSLEPGVAWLLDNRPVTREQRSVCHGDFHPGNVMVDGERVTGVLDWPGALLGDPEQDVAVSLVLVAVAGPMLTGGAPPGTFEAFAAAYLEAYVSERSVDPDRISYYRAYRVLRAFLRATAARTPGVASALLPRDRYPWASDAAMRRLAALFGEFTGVALPLPAGVGSE